MDHIQTVLTAGFWVSAALVLYTYLGYPASVYVLNRWRGRGAGGPGLAASAPQSVSVVLAAYNEEAMIGRRLDDLTRYASGRDGEFEVIVVSDGSTDQTASIARSYAGRGVRVIEMPGNVGKAAALSAGVAAARHGVVAFADARQTWAPDALDRLLDALADPRVGAVSGDLVLEAAPGAVAGVGLYWRFEKWLRTQEGRLQSTVGVTGAISAVRRRLFRSIPQGTILDDVYWPMGVVMQGYRVVHVDTARAFDRLPGRAADEFRRKVRTLSGNFQIAAQTPRLLLPWANPIWVQFVSHKLLRLLVPWALLAMLASSALDGRPVYRTLFVAQVAGYSIGLAGMAQVVSTRSRLSSAAASFVVLNAAAWVAFWVWLFGRAGQSWSKTAYEDPPKVHEPAVCKQG